MYLKTNAVTDRCACSIASLGATFSMLPTVLNG